MNERCKRLLKNTISTMHYYEAEKSVIMYASLSLPENSYTFWYWYIWDCNPTYIEIAREAKSCLSQISGSVGWKEEFKIMNLMLTKEVRCPEIGSAILISYSPPTRQAWEYRNILQYICNGKKYQIIQQYKFDVNWEATQEILDQHYLFIVVDKERTAQHVVIVVLALIIILINATNIYLIV